MWYFGFESVLITRTILVEPRHTGAGNTLHVAVSTRPWVELSLGLLSRATGIALLLFIRCVVFIWSAVIWFHLVTDYDAKKTGNSRS